MKKLSWIALAITAITVSLPGHAAVFGYYLSNTSGSPAGAITASGNTAVQLTNLTAADLVGIDVLWILNNNGAPDSNVTGNTAAVSSFVASGHVLSFHDRNVNQGLSANTYIPGAGGVTFVSSFQSDLDVQAVNTVTAGPFGVITNTTLDGGNLSSHGYALSSTLPAGAVEVLSEGADTTKAVDFYYSFGLGDVYYSGIPLDFYLGGSGANPPADDMRNIYARNEATFQAELFAGNGAVPEPGSLALLAVAGLMLLGQGRRAKASQG